MWRSLKARQQDVDTHFIENGQAVLEQDVMINERVIPGDSVCFKIEYEDSGVGIFENEKVQKETENIPI